MKKKMSCGLFVLAVCCFCLIAFPARSMAGPVVLKLAHSAPPKTLYDKSANKFAERVAHNTGGKVKVKVFGSAQFGGLGQQFAQVKAGAIDMVFSDYFAAFIVEPKPKNFFVTLVPYLFDSWDHFHKFQESDLFRSMMAKAEKGGNMKFVGNLGDRSYRILTTSDRKVVSPADCKGLKLRVPPAPPYVEVWKQWGATPTPTSAKEIYTSLKSGLVDGQDQTILVNLDAKFYEVQKYAMKMDHVPSTMSAWINRDKWDSLDPETQAAILKSAEETDAYINKEVARLTPEAEKGLQDNGMIFVEPDIKAFKEMAGKWAVEVDGKFWEKGLYGKIKAIK